MKYMQLHRRNFLLHLQERAGYDRPVLLKEPALERPSATHLNQLHNEYAITRRLADVPGVRPAYAKEGLESHPVLLLSYIQGHSLAELVNASTPLDLTEKLRIAGEATEVLSRIHEQQVMHKDINPSNILMGEDGRVYIIDFGIATALRQESQPKISPDDDFAGTLAYISPEQTGRMNRPVDYRTDFYSLGATLYELFTGQRPFETGEALEMIHSHIARQPVPPQKIDAEIPQPISDIILKLLAKNAEARYQTARGLQADLKTCLDQWQTNGWIEPFELGRDDFTGRLQISPKLYGRQAEIEHLLSTFERVAQSKAELLLLAGCAGVGKTTLVHEIHKTITAKQGYFIEGKFDQYQRSIPYTAWVQAFNGLVNSWMVESETDIDQRRAAILEAVGQNGQVLIDVIPNLELVIGPQPEVPEMGCTETQHRFNSVFQRFVRAVATPDHPLVIFIDDLQWIDLASLNLLKTLLTDPDSEHCLIIGAYRDNEVDTSHTLMLSLNDLQEAGGTVNQLTLSNLTLGDINQLLSDSLHTPSESCLPLARLVQAKTDGNAFFTHQLLHALEADALLSFDQASLCWQWDRAEVEQVAISDNVIDLMVKKIRKLPVATQEALKIAACLGNQFEMAMLSLFSGQPVETTQQALRPAFEADLLIQLNERSHFVHDRIQQAAYSLIPEPELAPLHWQIGRTLLRETPLQAQNERLFDLVGHLNLGASRIKTGAERIELAELNLKATQQALRATAYTAATAYAQTAIGLLAADGWQAHYLLTLKLHQLAAEATYLKRDFEQSEYHIAAILTNAQSLIDRVPAYTSQILVYQAQNLTNEAIETGLAVLDELGLTLLESAPEGLSVQAISELSPMTDPQAAATAEILDTLVLPAYVARPGIFRSLIYSALHLNLQFGLHPSSCLSVTAYAAFLWSEDIDRAYQFGELALQLLEKLKAHRYICQVRTSFDSHLLPWKSHYRTVERALRNDLQTGMETGEKSYAMACLRTLSFLNVFLRDRLDRAQENMTQNIRLLQRSGEDLNLTTVLVWTQFVVNLRGRSADPLCFEGPIFDEASDLLPAQSAGLFQTEYYLGLLKLILHYHLGHYQAALAHSEKAEQYLLNPSSTYFLNALLPFYQSLVILQLPGGQDQPPKLVEKFEQNLQKLQLWARHAPMNHQHKVDLILAEQARVAGDVAVAIDHYEAAITGARENAYRHEEALANECYARFWVERGNDRFAMQFMREAHALYKRWGAIAIVEHLEAQYPQWAKLDTLDIAQPHPETSLTSTYEKLALRSVLQTSRSITAELTLDRLLEKIMNIVLENAGAQRGLLLLKQERQWVVQATAAVDQSQPQVRQALRLMDYDELARSVVRYVARTGQTVILGDTAGAGQFVQDPYFQRRQVKSLLCLPLLNQGQIGGILYLENNLATDVFTSDRVALLEMLATQMAISIENARLYDRLGNALSTRTKALNSAEDQIRSLFENSTLGIALTTFDGQIITTNQALLGMLGYEEPELQSRNIVTLYHDPTQRTSLLQQLQTKQAVQNFGVEFRRKDRTVLFASLNVSLVTHNEREVLLTVVEDVTDKIKAEEALQTSQDLLQSALDALSANIAVLDQNGTIITVNASWRTFAEANGLAWTDHGLGRSYLEPAVAAAAQAAVGAAESATGIQALLSAQQDSFTLDYACHGPAEERWFAMRATRFESREGLRVVVSHEDITERVQAENQLKQAAAIAERDRIARELHDAVTQTLFSASGIAEATPRTWRKDPAMAQKNMAALTLMLRGALAEMRTLLLELRPDALRGQSLGQLLQTLVQATQSRTRTSISLAVNGNCPLPDEITLACYRIVQESLTNAVKHAEATEVRLIIDCDQNGLVLQIRDNGRGFDPSTVPAGHFGINFIRERVREIGGTFSIDSEPGAGTQIVVSWNVPQTSA